MDVPPAPKIKYANNICSIELGKRLLLFANFIAWAIEHNWTVLNPAFDDYAELFVGTAGDLLCGYPAPYFTAAGNKFVRSKYYNFIKYLSNKKILKTPEITRKEHFTWLKYQEIEQIKHGSIVCF